MVSYCGTDRVGNLFLHGSLPAALYWKIPLAYCVPFCVATYGAQVNSRPTKVKS
jgi:hypothetical protein